MLLARGDAQAGSLGTRGFTRKGCRGKGVQVGIAAQRPRDRRVAVPWCNQGVQGEAAEGFLGPLADASPRYLARDGQVFICGLVSLNCDQGVVSCCLSAKSQSLGTVVSKLGGVPAAVGK